jgi:hypothetical protein
MTNAFAVVRESTRRDGVIARMERLIDDFGGGLLGHGGSEQYVPG